jgi:hypothetical protein
MPSNVQEESRVSALNAMCVIARESSRGNHQAALKASLQLLSWSERHGAALLPPLKVDRRRPLAAERQGVRLSVETWA